MKHLYEFLFYFGAETVDTWRPAQWAPLITVNFYCGCELTIEEDGTIAETTHFMCDPHFNAIISGCDQMVLQQEPPMPELRFARPQRAADQPTVDRSTGATIYPHATKEQMIERAEAFLAGGCHVNFIGIPRVKVIEILRAALRVAPIKAVEGLEQLLQAMGIKDTD